MKSSEAQPLSADELTTLADLLRRWVLITYPYYGGSSEESDACQTYYRVREDADAGRHHHILGSTELAKYVKMCGESDLE